MINEDFFKDKEFRVQFDSVGRFQPDKKHNIWYKFKYISLISTETVIDINLKGTKVCFAIYGEHNGVTKSFNPNDLIFRKIEE